MIRIRLIVALLCIAAVPPLPKVKKRYKTAIAPTQGSGVQTLLSKATPAISPLSVTIPSGRTNVIPWKYGKINSNSYWWNLQVSTNLKTWTTIISNVTETNCWVTNTLKPGVWVYRLVGRTLQ